MTANWIDPVVKDYLFHDSPLRNPASRRTLWIIIAVVVVLSFLGWLSLLKGRSPLVILGWVPLSAIGSVIGYLILAFLDRERRVRLFHFLTMASVTFITGPAAAFFNHHSPIKLWSVGFFEEGFKILPVLLLAVYVPNLIRTRKDGLVYGALAGMGFNLVEIGAYIQAAAADGNTTMQALYLHLPRLGLWGLGGHIIWSAFVGLGIGMAAEATKTGWAKWKRAVIFYLIAAVAHSAFDLGGSLLGVIPVTFVAAKFQGIDFATAFAEMPNQPGPLHTALRYGTYIYNLVFIIVLIIQTRKSFAMENTLQVEELSSEEPAVMAEHELTQLKAERLFFKRRYKDYPKKVSSKMVLYQNLLAMQKHTARQLGRTLTEVEPVAALRQAVQSLRG